MDKYEITKSELKESLVKAQETNQCVIISEQSPRSNTEAIRQALEGAHGWITFNNDAIPQGQSNDYVLNKITTALGYLEDDNTED